jgi:uncharacterized protein YegJ (DUF2314 family)
MTKDAEPPDLGFYGWNPLSGQITTTSGDEVFNAAIKRARETLPDFIARLQAAAPGEAFSVRARFQIPDGGGEHMWLDEVTFDGTHFHGKLSDDAYNIETLHFGDLVSVEEGTVTNWLIEKDGVRHGEFLLKALDGEPLEP